MRFVTGTILIALIAAYVQARPADSAASKLEGTYTIVSGKRDGKPLPAEEIKGQKVTFTSSRITGYDKDRKVFFAASYRIDDTTSPYTIHMTGISPKKGEKATGVISITGDTVKVCYNLPGGKAPRNFEAGPKQHCFILKKAR